MIDKNKRVTSAIFRDKKGVSVDRAWHRNIEEAVNMLRISRAHKKNKSPNDYAVISVTKSDCDSIGAICLYDPIEENIYHSLIQKSRDKIELTRTQAKALTKLARIEYGEIKI